MTRSRARGGFSLVELSVTFLMLMALSVLVTVGVVRYLDSSADSQAVTLVDATAEAQHSHLRRFGGYTSTAGDIESALGDAVPVRADDVQDLEINEVAMATGPDDEAVLLAVRSGSGACFYRSLATERAPAALQLRGSFDADDVGACSPAAALAHLSSEGTPPWS